MITSRRFPVAVLDTCSDAPGWRLSYPGLLKTALGSLLLLAALGMLTTAFGSWTTQASGTTSNLLAVQFPIDASTGYVVGRSGTILKTTNGGARWSKLNARTRNNLLAVHFPMDATTGYAVGINGTIVKTTNGGASWTVLTSGTTNHLLAVHFPRDTQTGYVGGYAGTLLKTTDGGAHWTPVAFTGNTVARIRFPNDAQTGYAAVTDGTIGEIYKTTDSGASWTRMMWREDEIMRGLQFPADVNSGYALTWRNMLKTVDGGAVWSLLTPFTEDTYGMHFPSNAQTGYVVGARGAVYKTTDGGTSWSEGGTGVAGILRDVYFADETTGYAVGDGGVILKTTDGGGGNTFTAVMHPTADGSVNAFTGTYNCTAHWDCVNDQPGNAGSGAPATPGSYTLVMDGSGNREMYALDDGIVGPGYRITAIRVTTTLAWGTSRIQLSYRRTGTDPAPVDTPEFFGLAELCCTPYSWTWSGLDWTGADLDALEIGIKHVSGGPIYVEQLYVKVYYEPIN